MSHDRPALKTGCATSAHPSSEVITSAMVRAGVEALEAQLLDGEAIEAFRPVLVRAVYRAMVAHSPYRHRSRPSEPLDSC